MPTGYARILYIVGIVLMLLGLTDVLLQRFANIDVTKVTWSPLVLGGIGIVCMNVARFMSRSNTSEFDQ